MTMNGLETFTTKETVENTITDIKKKLEFIGANPAYKQDYDDLMKTLGNLESKVAANKN